MTERRQLSGYGFVERIGPIYFIAIGSLGFSGIVRWGINVPLGIMSMLFLGLGCFFAYRAFKKTHPVYFDDNAFYWKKNRIEQTADYLNVISLFAHSATGRGGRRYLSWLELTYTDTNNLTSSLSFYPISVFKTDPIWLLVQCEKAIQAKNPEFLITGYTAPFIAEKEIEKNRKYKLH